MLEMQFSGSELEIRIVVVNEDIYFLVFTSSYQISGIRTESDIGNGLLTLKTFWNLFPIESEHDSTLARTEGENNSSIRKCLGIHSRDRVSHTPSINEFMGICTQTVDYSSFSASEDDFFFILKNKKMNFQARLTLSISVREVRLSFS